MAHPAVAHVRARFAAQGISLRNEWLDGYVDHLRMQNTFAANTSAEAVYGHVYRKWLEESIERSTLPGGVPADMGAAEIIGGNGGKPAVLQIDFASDVGESAFSQLETVKNKGELPSHRSANRALLLKMTDGDNSILGFEYLPLPGISVSIPPGTKIEVRNAKVARGIVLLGPENVRVLGGNVEELSHNNNYKHILMKRLGIEPSPAENDGNEDEVRLARALPSQQSPVRQPRPHALPPQQQQQQQQPVRLQKQPINRVVSEGNDDGDEFEEVDDAILNALAAAESDVLDEPRRPSAADKNRGIAAARQAQSVKEAPEVAVRHRQPAASLLPKAQALPANTRRDIVDAVDLTADEPVAPPVIARKVVATGIANPYAKRAVVDGGVSGRAAAAAVSVPVSVPSSREVHRNPRREQSNSDDFDGMDDANLLEAMMMDEEDADVIDIRGVTHSTASGTAGRSGSSQQQPQQHRQPQQQQQQQLQERASLRVKRSASDAFGDSADNRGSVKESRLLLKPYAHLSDVVEEGATVSKTMLVRVKGYVRHLSSNVRPSQSGYELEAHIDDGTAVVCVALSDTVVAGMARMPSAEFRALLKQGKRDEAAASRASEVLSRIKNAALRMEGVFVCELPGKDGRPLVVRVERPTEGDRIALQQRVAMS